MCTGMVTNKNTVIIQRHRSRSTMIENHFPDVYYSLTRQRLTFRYCFQIGPHVRIPKYELAVRSVGGLGREMLARPAFDRHRYGFEVVSLRTGSCRGSLSLPRPPNRERFSRGDGCGRAD